MTRTRNKQDMSITEQLETVRDKICAEYCKHTEAYLSCYKDPDEAYQKQQADICNYCPMREL